VFLSVLDETGFFDASLYTPYSVVGIETLGFEVAQQARRRTGRFPDVVVATHAGGGNVTGTARGLLAAGAAATRVVGVSVDLGGLHMASDRDFNRKSFTTGHTGFSMPFTTWPDRSDVPRSAARPLRYLDRFVTVTQGEVLYVTEALAQLEGMQRGAAGNTSLAAAMVLVQDLPRDAVVVVQETEYTGAGKHPLAQLDLARRQGIRVERGDPATSRPGESIVIPEHPAQLQVTEVDLDRVRQSYLRNALATLPPGTSPMPVDLAFLAEETRTTPARLKEVMDELAVAAR
jgi:threonine synthase